MKFQFCKKKSGFFYIKIFCTVSFISLKNRFLTEHKVLPVCDWHIKIAKQNLLKSYKTLINIKFSPRSITVYI